MLNYVVQETAVREGGQSSVFALGENTGQTLVVTLAITHAMEQESLDLDIYTSADGLSWPKEPEARFRQKSYCGTYHLTLPRSEARYMKAVWEVSRWRHSAGRPFFQFYVSAEPVRAMAGAA